LRSVSLIPIRLIVENLGEAEGELTRFLSPRTVDALVRRLPLEGRAALLNGGVYFPVPLDLGMEKAKRIAERGTLAYWPMGRAICIFYDKTKPYSPINHIGKVKENLGMFRQVKAGTKITIKRI